MLAYGVYRRLNSAMDWGHMGRSIWLSSCTAKSFSLLVGWSSGKSLRVSVGLMLALGAGSCTDADSEDAANTELEANSFEKAVSSRPIDNCNSGHEKLELFEQFPYYLVVFPITLMERRALEESDWEERGLEIGTSNSTNFFSPLREYKAAAADYYSGYNPEKFSSAEFQKSMLRIFYEAYEENLALQDTLILLVRGEPRATGQDYDLLEDIVPNMLIAVAINTSLSTGDERYFKSAILKIFSKYQSYDSIASYLPEVNYPLNPQFPEFEDMHRRFVNGRFDNVWRIATMKLYLDLRPELAANYYSRVAHFGRQMEVREDGAAFILQAEFDEEEISDFVENGICQYPYRRAVWDYLFYRKALKSKRQDVNILRSEKIYFRTGEGDGS